MSWKKHDWTHFSGMPIIRQCELIGLCRSSLYYESAPESSKNLQLMRLIDQQYTRTPCYGSHRITWWLTTQGHEINRNRVQRLMQLTGLAAIHPGPKTNVTNKEHTVYPYLLRNLQIVRPNQIWSTEITYIPMKNEFMFLVAVLDWYTDRYCPGESQIRWMLIFA